MLVIMLKFILDIVVLVCVFKLVALNRRLLRENYYLRAKIRIIKRKSLIDETLKLIEALSASFISTRFIGQRPRDLTPCKYCHRYDAKVELIQTDGLNGRYHPFCASEIVRSMCEELARRMA